MMTIAATNVYYLYASRFLIGLVGGKFLFGLEVLMKQKKLFQRGFSEGGVGVAVPAFVLEISNDK